MNIVLTGFMGTGKSAVGRRLAGRLGWQFVDIDETIEKEVGMRISQIFARDGEAHFRDLESKTIRLVGLLDRAVISCGGGAVLRKENMEELERNGVVVCLAASPETILERTKGNADRPLLAVKDPKAKIAELIMQRKPFYERCSVMIDTTKISAGEVVDRILAYPTISSRLK